MTTWVTEVGSSPTFWLVPVDSLPDGDAVIAHIRALERPKVVALVGYHDDAEAGSIAKRLPYGYRGDGVEEIVFCRVGPATGEVVQFAVEYDAEGAVVVVTGRAQFVDEVGELVG